MLRPSVVVHEETIPEGGALIVGQEGGIIGLIVEGWGNATTVVAWLWILVILNTNYCKQG